MNTLALRGWDRLPVFGQRENWASDEGIRHGETAVGKGVRVACGFMSPGFQDIGQGSWHKETNGRPVTITMFKALLIFVDGVGLDVGDIPIHCWQSRYFPGDHVSDIAIWFKPTEDDCVASEDCSPFPGAREDCDAVLDTGLGFLVTDVSYG